MPIRSNDPEFTVSPQVLASNLVVMGSVPPVVPADAAQQAIDHHGAEYAEALFAALEAAGRRVERPAPAKPQRPEVLDADGANLDPRECDCGKGSVCPLMTPAWAAFLADQGVDLDTWSGSWDNVPSYAVVDLRDGSVFTKDADGEPLATKPAAERFARSRNTGLRVAAQTYRVVRLEAALFADVKPRY